MPRFDGAVGLGGQNQRHDVAVVQAALGKLARPDRKPFWPGPIDGDYQRHRRALDQAIGTFQHCHRLRASGKFNRLGSDVNRLERPAGESSQDGRGARHRGRGAPDHGGAGAD